MKTHTEAEKVGDAARAEGLLRELAQERDAHAETEQELAELRALYNANAMKAELERVRGELSKTASALVLARANRDTLFKETADLSLELDQAKRDLRTETARGDRNYDAHQKLEADLAALREGRPEPTDEELGESLESAFRMHAYGDETGNVWHKLSRAAKSLLLGVRPRGVVDREALAKVIREVVDSAGDYEDPTDEIADAVISALGARVVPTREEFQGALAAFYTDTKGGDEDRFYAALFAAPDVGEKDSRPTGQKEGSDGERNEYGGDDSAAGSDRPRERGPHDSAPGHGNHDRRAEERAQVAGAQHRDHEARGSSDVGRRSDVQRPDVGSTGVAPAAGEKKGHLQPNEPPDPLPETLPAQSIATMGPATFVLRGTAELDGDKYWGQWTSSLDDSWVGVTDIDWAHWRAQQAKPDLPGGHGPTKPLEERVEALERRLGRLKMHKEWCSLDLDHDGDCRNERPPTDQSLAARRS